MCRVVGGVRAVDGQAEYLEDQILGRCFLDWKVECCLLLTLRYITVSQVFNN